MLATLQHLGIVPSFSRPGVSDDSPFIESLFRTLKYRPEYPHKPFENIEAAQAWVTTFVAWYNAEHRHSGIRFVTPDQRHDGRENDVLANRVSVCSGTYPHTRRSCRSSRAAGRAPSGSRPGAPRTAGATGARTSPSSRRRRRRRGRRGRCARRRGCRLRRSGRRGLSARLELESGFVEVLDEVPDRRRSRCAGARSRGLSTSTTYPRYASESMLLQNAKLDGPVQGWVA